MLGFQAEGSAPIVHNKIIKHPETIATAIRIGNPASWQQAVSARNESKGLIDMVSDQEILSAYKLLASLEGVFTEPASASSVAGLLKLKRDGYFAKIIKNSKKVINVVCILTGHGLKDPDRVIKSINVPETIPATLKAIIKEIL